uniref:O-fucosyltransferase family protein n=1 Tax=Salix viminalis TaxID=40686 RepID=A0A6N2LFN3_SALVM
METAGIYGSFFRIAPQVGFKESTDFIHEFTEESIADYQSSVTIFSWNTVFENPDFSKNSPSHKRLVGPVRRLESLHPDANPKRYITDPRSESSGLQFKVFAYLYNEDNFMAALVKNVKVVKTLPQNLKDARKLKNIPSFRVPNSASPYFYLHHVSPVLNKHGVVELAILPPHLDEYQRLRCRVAFHALRFRQEVQELATKMLHRLRAHGQPFIAFDPGLTRDALAYYGCAELFQDVHNELIQHKRAWMKKRGFVKGKLSVNSAEQRLNGSCPLMPEEVGILLRAYGYSWDTILYVSGGEVFGGQRTLTPLHAMFENIVDRTSLSAAWELNRIYGREVNLVDTKLRAPPSAVKEKNPEVWKNAGPRPRPLPPPPARPKYPYNIEGWWGWVAESDNEPESTVMELRTNAHKLLWEAIDYLICVEADVFIPGFDRDGKGRPNFASLVMGHRLYQSAASKTFQPNRKEVVKLLEENREHLYQANHTWLTSIRSHLRRSLIDGVIRASRKSKPSSFLSHPVPECSCLRYDLTKRTPHSTGAPVEASLGLTHHCPKWMDKESEEDPDEDISSSSGLFFRNSGGNHESGGGELIKEESQLDDQEELDGAD